MTTWLQNSDFSSIEIDHLANYLSFEQFFKTFEFAELDKAMLNAQSSNEETCPWGIGVNMDTDFGMHLWREDPQKNTFGVTVVDMQKKKVFGVFSRSVDYGFHKEGLDEVSALVEVAGYYDSLHKRQT